MFEDYIQDAYAFFELAEQSVADERKQKMFYRASIFCAASSLEAFINFIGDTMKKSERMDRIEVAYITDKSLEVSPAKGIAEEKIKFNSIDNKIKFIITKFGIPFNVSNSSQWSSFLNLKKLRDDIVHPKNIDDEIGVTQYKAVIKSGLSANIDIMNIISQKIFSKPIRKSLLDLKL